MTDSTSLNERLQLLSQAGLIRQQHGEPGLEYSFVSALVYETARGSLVKQDRRLLHLAIGEALENLYSDRLEEIAPILGDHFHHAGQSRRAMLYYTLSGNLALAKYANAEAARYFTNSLVIARSEFRQGSEIDQAAFLKALGELYHKRGQALWWSGGYNQAIENYKEMENLAKDQADKEMELACLTDLSNLYSSPNPKFDAERGELIALQAQQIARQLNDHSAEARILWILMMNGFFSNQPQKAVSYGEQSLVLARKHNLQEQTALTLADLTKYVYTPQMKFDLALASLAEAQSIWGPLENKPRLADSYLTEAIIYVNLGEFHRASELVEQGVELAKTVGSLWNQAYGWMIQGQVHLELGEYDDAFRVLDDSYRTSELSGFMAGLTIVYGLQSVLLMRLGAIYQAMPYCHYAVKTAESQAPFWLTQALGGQAMLYVEIGDLPKAEAAINRSHLHTKEHFLGFYSNYLPMAECALLLKREDYSMALSVVEEILTILYAQNARGILAYFLYYKGMALVGLGRLEEACQVLGEACSVAESISARWPLWRSLASLADLNDRLGRPDQVKAYRQAARQVIEFICLHSGTSEMRRQFTELPEVQLILNATTPLVKEK
jgi:tetratricopeptide (TPR) repeat protein